jgi:hypothetical protein
MRNIPAGQPEPTQPRRRMRDRLAIPVMIAFGLLVVAAGAWSVGAFSADDAPGPVVAGRDPLLPDLAMGPITNIAVGTTENGDERLRFDATIVNIGKGPFLLRAQRPWLGNEQWSVVQWMQEQGGGYSTFDTKADLVYGGDGHNHWHVKQVEVHQLETLDGKILGRLVKQGFCFFDTDPYDVELTGVPPTARWSSRGCAGSFDTRVRMGLSVGWGDNYPWHIIDERIDVTKVPDGRYRIREIADPNNEFEESDEANNDTWVEIDLKKNADGVRDAIVAKVGPPPKAPAQ